MNPSGLPLPGQERAFLQTVVYASLFDYPLTLRQVRDDLIGEVADDETIARWYRNSPRLQAAIERADDYYFPRGRRELVETRARREDDSRARLVGLKHPLRLVTSMPFVRMVALSGSLAHLNADREADLDLFVITKRGRVWSVTLTVLVIARLLGWRRSLCLNYVVSDRGLRVGPADLFSANQIVHLQPIIGAEMYERFLDANRFVERFYPNFRARALPMRQGRWTGTRHIARLAVEALLDWTVAPPYERLCRIIYGRHLRRRAPTWRSRDQVRLEPETLKLHTSSHRREVMEQFERALESAGDAFRREESLPVRAAR